MLSPADPVREPVGRPRSRGADAARGKLVVIFFLALAVRLLALLQVHDSPWCAVPLGDARFFDEWGQRIAAGHWLGDEVFYQAPLYPYFLGVLYALFGHAAWLVRLIQLLLGALSAVLVAAGTRRLFPGRAGAAAGVLAALYAPAIWYDLQIEKTSLALFLTSVLFYLSLARPVPSGARWTAGTGVTLGALTLLRENSAILLVPLLFAFGRERAGRGKAVAALLAGFGLVLLPVGLRNLAVGGAFLPTTANTGVNFYIGNGAEADGQYRPLVAGRGHPDFEREDARRIAQDLSGRELSPAQVSGFWLARAGAEIGAEPGHFVGLLAHKVHLLLHHGEIMDAVALEVFQDEAWVLRGLGILSFGVLLALSLAGLVLAWKRPGILLPTSCALLLGLSVVAFFVVGRFRLGLVPFLLPFAAFTLVELRQAPRRSLALGAAGLGLLLAWWPLVTSGDARATSDSNLSCELLRRGDFTGAERWARAAWERDAASADAAFNLGLALKNQGKNEEAVLPFREAMRLEPAYTADSLAELGLLRARASDEAGARKLLDEALRIDPGHSRARAYRAELGESHGSR